MGHDSMFEAIEPGSAPVCPVCGKQLPPNARFCNKCGKQLTPAVRFCRNCGKQPPTNARFCNKCGTAITTSSRQTFSNRFAPAAQTLPQYAAAIPKTHRKIRLKPLPLIAGLLVVAILVGVIFNKDRLFGSITTQTNQTTTSSGQAGQSGSRALDVTPMQGLRIIAAENAMDKDRTFTAKQLTDDASLLEFPGEALGQLPLAAFSIDAGMEEGEIFPGEVEIRFDLARLDIPEELWDDLGILRIEGDSWTNLATSRMGSELVCSTRKNSVFWIVFTLGAMSWVSATKDRNDKTSKFNYLGGPYVREAFTDYNLYWPATMEPANKSEADRVAQIYQSLSRQYGILSAKEAEDAYRKASSERSYYSALSEHCHRLASMYRDPEYIRLRELCTAEWRRDNLYPERVKIAVTALEKANTYLFTVRHLRKPKHRVDVLMLSTWPTQYAADELAISAGNAFQDGFIMVNLSDYIFAGYSAQQSQSGKTLAALFQLSEKQDELNITMVHELFHVVQEEYFTIRMDKNIRPLGLNKYMWFLEATAVTLSGEANVYYVSKGWNQRLDILEDRDYWETFSNPLNDNSSDEMTLRRHGYTASLFLEALRDDFTFNRNGKADYIPKVMEAFAGLFANSVSSLYAGGGATEDDLVQAFSAFAGRQSERMYQNIAAKAADAGGIPLLAEVFHPLDTQHPIYIWQVISIKPLSAELRILSTKMLSRETLDNAFIYLVNGRNNSLERFNLYHNIRLTGGEWTKMTTSLQRCAANRLDQLVIQRIDLNPAPVNLSLSNKSFIPADMTFKVLLMLQHEAPAVTIKDQAIEIAITDSTLKSILAGQDVPIPLTYTVSIKVPYVDAPFLFTIDESEQKTSISIDPKIRIGEAIQYAVNKGNAELEITWWESVKMPGQPEPLTGPVSKVLKIHAESPEKWVGTWTRTTYEDSIIITNPLALVDNPDLQKKVEAGRGKVIVTHTVVISAYQKDGCEYRIDWTEKRVDTYENNENQKTTTYLGKPGETPNTIGARKYVDGQLSSDYNDWEVLYYLDNQTILFRDYEHMR